MDARSSERIGRVALLGGGLLFLAAGAGWAAFGTEIFLSAIMAGLAYCF